MTRRLVITNGDWTTRHEIGEAAVVIGRDPGCDLFFVNQKLSRRHARVEPGPDGVLLVDLGSRNGIWVNENKIDRHLLASGDSIRLGGLQIVYEEDGLAPSAKLGGEDATVVVSDAPGDEERTVLLRQDDTEPGGGTTVMLANGAATVLLAGGTEPASTVLEASTGIPPPSDAAEQGESEAGKELGLAQEPVTVRVSHPVTALPWQVKFSTIVFGLTLLLIALVGWLVVGGSVVALVVWAVLTASLVALVATVLARRLLVRPVVNLRRAVEGLEDGASLSQDGAYPELGELASSIDRLVSRTPRTEEESQE